MGLFSPAWQSKNHKKRRKAVMNETDQTKLIRIAKEARDFEIRCVAVEKLTDQPALLDIAKNDGNSNVRLKAAIRLVDPTILKQITQTDKNLFNRSHAFSILYERNNLEHAEIEAIINATMSDCKKMDGDVSENLKDAVRSFHGILSPEDRARYGFKIDVQENVNIYEEGFSQRSNLTIRTFFYKGKMVAREASGG